MLERRSKAARNHGSSKPERGVSRSNRLRQLRVAFVRGRAAGVLRAVHQRNVFMQTLQALRECARL
jgi:hypothetical protein